MVMHAAHSGNAYANGVELVAPVDRPVPPTPDRPLPFPVEEEAAPRGAPSIVLEALPDDFVYLTTAALTTGITYDNALAQKQECFESVILRGTSIAVGKVVIPAGGLAYVAETWPGALPFRQDALCIGGTLNTLIDFEQTIVTRKNVNLSLSEATVLGSEIFRLKSVTELGPARSALIEVSALSGFDWGELGTGNLLVSSNASGWHGKTFRYGFHQGRVEEVTPKAVRFAWLSGLRADSVVLAKKREFSGKVVAGGEVLLSTGRRVRVVRINPTLKLVQLETPDGKKP
jgi:hypothetical protein